jgi:hypothetical protein
LRALDVVSSTTFGYPIALLHGPLLLKLFTLQDAETNETRYRTLLTSSAGLENAKKLVTAYKTGKMPEMTPELWNAKKIIDSTIHPGTIISVIA